MDKLLRNNTVLRVVAVIIACILWLTVNAPNETVSNTGTGVEKIPFTLPVHIQLSSDMSVTSLDRDSATVNVGGDFSNVMGLPAKMLEVELVVHAEGLAPGKHTLQITALNIPTEVSSYSISPASIRVFVQKRTTNQTAAS